MRGVSSEGALVFISHGRETQALSKVENFLRVLGAQPVVVMRKASEGMAVDDIVEKRIAESDCAIGTCDRRRRRRGPETAKTERFARDWIRADEA